MVWVCINASISASVRAITPEFRSTNNGVILSDGTYDRLGVSKHAAAWNPVSIRIPTDTTMVHKFEPFYLLVRYRKGSELYLQALFDSKNNRPLIPVAELFRSLEIYHTIHTDSCDDCIRMEGIFLTNGDWFRIDTYKQEAVYGATHLKLPPEDYVLRSGEIYLTPALLSRLFQISVHYASESVALILSVDHLFPYEERLIREYRRNRISVHKSDRLPFQQSEPKPGTRLRRAFLGGGVMDYQVQLQSNRTFGLESANYRLKGGFELLGGSAWISRSGIWLHRPGGQRDEWNGQWMLEFDHNPWISTITAGKITSSGVLRRSMTGFSITNRPRLQGSIFGMETVSGKTIPGSDVDLYLQDKMIAYSTVGYDGRYSFDVPLMYGLNTIQVETITNEGVALLHTERIHIPQGSMRQGSIVYGLSYGRTSNQSWAFGPSDWMLHASAKGGITSRQTVEAGFDWQGNRTNPEWIWLEWTQRFRKEQFVSAQWIRGHQIQTDWRRTLGNGAMVSASYAKYQKRSAMNPSGLMQKADLQWNQTLSIGFVPFVMQAAIDMRQAKRLLSTGLQASLFFQVGRFQLGGNLLQRVECRGRACEEQQTSWRLTGRYRMPDVSFVPVFARSWNLRSSLSGGGRQLPLRRLDLRMSKQTRWAGIHIGWSYQFLTKQSALNLGFRTSIAQTVSSRSNIQVRESGFQMGQAFSGSIGFDSSTGRFIRQPIFGVGYAGLSVLLFLDTNANETYEPDVDVILPYAAVRIPNHTKPELGQDGVLRFSRLPQQRVLEVEIIPSKLPDPFLLPAKPSYQIHARTNRYQELHIPFYYGGWIEGEVVIGKPFEKTPFAGAGIKLRLWRPESPEEVRIIPTFRDGTFYVDELLPGMYRIKPDENQMEALHLVTSNPWIEFEITGNPEDPMPDPIRFHLREDTSFESSSQND